MTRHARYEPTTTGPRNRPMRSDGYSSPVVGRRRMDRRHDLAMDRTGCLFLLLVLAPYLFTLGRSLHLW